ncbi:MAG: helix-turn-helix domain-containing protein, partial [Acidimicrobiia bacterium]
MTSIPGDAQPGAGASELLSVAEAARMLGISRTLGYELVVRQELPSVRFGTRVYVLRRAVALLVGAGEDEVGVGGGARLAEPSARRRPEPDGQAAAAALP